jgi:hypothetical protein
MKLLLQKHQDRENHPDSHQRENNGCPQFHRLPSESKKGSPV